MKPTKTVKARNVDELMKWLGGNNPVPESALPDADSVRVQRADLGHAGQTLSRPTAAGWWLMRKDGEERVCYVREMNDGSIAVFRDRSAACGTRMHDGEAEWARPLAPPCSQIDPSSATP